MNQPDSKQTALVFNEAINAQDTEGLSRLTTRDHTFIDRNNQVYRGKETMIQTWQRFFAEFPEYRSTFSEIVLRGDLILTLGYAKWSQDGPPDHVIWGARIRNGLVAEWRICADTSRNRLGITIR